MTGLLDRPARSGYARRASDLADGRKAPVVAAGGGPDGKARTGLIAAERSIAAVAA